MKKILVIMAAVLVLLLRPAGAYWSGSGGSSAPTITPPPVFVQPPPPQSQFATKKTITDVIYVIEKRGYTSEKFIPIDVNDTGTSKFEVEFQKKDGAIVNASIAIYNSTEAMENDFKTIKEHSTNGTTYLWYFRKHNIIVTLPGKEDLAKAAEEFRSAIDGL